ncbi:hypothetical protein PC115_g5212 [Phytophthora cactorum]|uniref:Uncharacterized protein n=1 Tax=Phytophthora cactorum TaxID=29920 RepID=A0A8T1D408_9STRA|nr:hypothetical protein PC115_g5212 [Phytophthora cactorum]
MKGRFIINPFQELNLTPADRTSLEDLANQCITSNLQLCMKYMSGTTRRVDPQHWKPLKEKEKLKVYSERPEGVAAATASGNEPTGSGLPMILSSTSVSSVDCARAMMLKHHKVNHSSVERTMSSDDNSGEYSYASAQ